MEKYHFQRFQEIGQSLPDVKLSHPKEYLDPLTSELMTDPVISPMSGQTFQRSSIVAFINQNHSDPINGKPLTVEQLIPNASFASIIEKYNASTQGSAWFNN